ncbi:MAG: DUF5916 domain-containing protein [Vicinamibacterales bacterium]
MIRRHHATFLSALAWLAWAAATTPASATTGDAIESPHPLIGADGAAASSDGRLVIAATRAATPVRIDGALDDDVWSQATPVGDFVQGEPLTGSPATEATDVKMAYDGQNLYVAAYLHDSDPDHLVVNEIRKDFKNDVQDTFEIIIDTFGDRRNGFVFMTNPEGARADQQVANEGRETNASWDAVWFVKTRQVADGWIAEIAIPFKSLRFEPGDAHRWGINFSRRIRRKNEVDFWSPVPRAYTLSRVSLAGELQGLQSLNPGRNLRIKPYVAGSAVRPGGGPDFTSSADVGLDVKYGLTPALTLDATVNPDFAQAEADEQQVNLTQFSQFFPEKRDFFLENSGIFYVGDTARNNRVNVSPTPDEDLLLFFSRSIGLTASGIPIDILGGARVTGKVAGLNVGVLDVQTRGTAAQAATNYTVLRAKRNLGRANDVGVIYMGRTSTERANDYNRVYGVDWNLRFLKDLDWNTYAVRTRTPGRGDGQYAWRSSLSYEGNFFHWKSGLLQLGENFQSDLSYFRRVGTRKYILDTGVRPRSPWLRAHGIREIHPHVVWNYYENLQGHMNGKRLHSGLSIFFNNGGFVEWSENPEFQLITSPLRLSPAAPLLPAGGYGWNEHQLRLTTDTSRTLVANAVLIKGGLWSGDQRSANVTLTYQPSYRFRVAVGLQHTDADLPRPVGSFTTNFWTIRPSYSFTTNMFLDALLQYLSDRQQFNANVRFNLIHHPLSDLYVVYNEQRFQTSSAPMPGRGIIVKFTQMMAF